MSFSVPGSTWAPKTATQHAESVLAAINSAVASLNITFVPSLSNVVWLLCLGIGSVAALFDVALSSAKNSFNPALCDDAQILQMSPITGLVRFSGSYSTLNVKFTAGAGNLTVPVGTHVRVSNQTAQFLVDQTTVVPSGTQVSIATTCDTIGPIQVAAGQATSIVETLANFSGVTNTEVAVAGVAQESVASFRQRIIDGGVVKNSLNDLIYALRNLPGINQAQVYFNYSTTTPLSLPGSITLAVRTLLIVISGSSSEIAQTWADHTLAPTQGALSQNYVSLSGQSVPVYYEASVSVEVYVRVYVSSVLPSQSGYAGQIKAIVMAASSLVKIGQTITEEFILDQLSGFKYAVINGATVSLDNITYGRTAAVSAKAIASFVDAKISVIAEP